MPEHVEAINWPNFSVAVSKGTARPWERTDRGMAGQWSKREHTYLWIELTVLCGHSSRYPKTITVIISKDHDHLSVMVVLSVQ